MLVVVMLFVGFFNEFVADGVFKYTMLSNVACLRCGYMVFGRFDGYFREVFQRFGTRFVSAIAHAFRLWFLEMTAWFGV